MLYRIQHIGTNNFIQFYFQVNADIRSYIVHSDNTQTLASVNTSHVGKAISTKAVGSNLREDVTLEYKFQEGSTSERAALLGKHAIR